MKFIALFMLLTTAAFAENQIQILSGTEKGYDDVLTQVEAGVFEELVESRKIQGEGEYTLKFQLLPVYRLGSYKLNQHMMSAERIARYAWYRVWGELKLKSPFPCGVYTEGEVKTTVGNNSFALIGEGDGEFDSCTGRGYPGAWMTSVSVKFDPATNTGTMTLYGFVE